MERRLTILLPQRLAADLQRACAIRETTLSEYTRDALRRAVAADRVVPDHQQRGELPAHAL